MSPAAVLGFDIGGSKTKALRVEDGRVVREARAGAANIDSVGVEEAGLQLDRILDDLGREGVAAVCAGAAGADTEVGLERLARLFRERLPQARLSVVHDARLMLVATGLDQGIVVIAGTGSVAWGRRSDGEEARAGGWGHLLDDEGSGYWVAQQAVRHALAAYDRGDPVDRLTVRLTAACGVTRPDQLYDHFYAHPTPRGWADRAGIVFDLADADDPPSRRIVAGAGQALAEFAVVVAGRLGLPGPVVLAGGLAVHQPLLQKQIRTELSQRGIAELHVLKEDPVLGAIHLAQQLLSQPN